ncbi:ABC transporter ATP-binding protein [Streptomyces albidoflavus]|uniref:ABC transporter ATP-binding protein n=1 Tax=Streptomyces albidoflavus TaxID=1886 RepID=UPI00332213DA
MNYSLRGGGEPCGSDAARLRAQNLIVRYRDKIALEIPDLTLKSGITALTGSNGAGKSTLLKVLALLLPPSSGDIALNVGGENIKSTTKGYRKAVGYLPQESHFPGHFTVQEAVTYSAWLRGISRSNRAESVHQVLDRLGLSDVASKRLKQLSGGNRQRAHIAQAVVHKPALLLLDEPTTGVDVEHRIELRTHLAELSQSCCIVMSTHHTEDVELLSERVVSLREGQVIFDGTPQELASRVAGKVDNPVSASRGARPIEQALHDLGGGR